MSFIAGTGTRKIQNMDVAEKTKVLDILIGQIDQWDTDLGMGQHTIISGMAEGFDSALAIAALKHGNPLHLYIPNRGYGEYYWGKNSLSGRNRKAEFDAIVAQSERVEYTDERIGVSGLYHNGIHLNFWRNQAMVDDADVLFGWVTGPNEADGGTADCVRRWNIKREDNSALYFPPVVPIKAMYEGTEPLHPFI